MVIDFPNTGLVANVTEHIHPQTGTVYLWNGTQWVVKQTSAPGVQGGLPIGAIVPHSSTVIPPGFFECAGQSLERAAYPTLYAMINTIWGEGDIPGTTFALPDFRGEFLRGWDHSKGVDIARDFATSQSDLVKAHDHDMSFDAYGEGSSGGSDPTGFVVPNTDTLIGPYTNSVAIQNNVGVENRPRNVAIMYLIKAYDTLQNPGMIDVSILAQFIATSQSQANFSDNQNGYLQLPDWLGGFIVNWGKVVSAVNGDTTNAVTFAKDYISIPHIAIATIEGASGSAVLASAYITGLTTSGMNVVIDVSGAFSRNAFWFTVGK